MKRPDRELYIAPALRSKDCEDQMEYAKDKFASEAANRRAYSLGNRDSSQRTTNIAPRRVRSDSSSSSSNPRNISDESCKDDDSSDFEDCCSVPTEAVSDEEISMGTNEKNSDVHWNKERRGKPTKNNQDIETENYQTNTKISNRILMKHEDYSDVKSHANQLPNFESNETKLDRGLFFYSDDSSISDIEAITDDRMKKGRVLTSTPNSDIVEQKVLDAAKYVPEEESGLESTLLSQSDIHEITINTNRNKCDCNFEIYQDPSSVTSHSTDYSEIFGNNYIPPPVPPPASGFRLPPIHRLPSPVSSPRELSVFHHVSPQKMPQLLPQLRRPRLLLPPSLQLYSRLPPSPSSFIPPNSSHMSLVPRYVLQPAPPLAPNPPRMPSSIPSTLLPQERFNPPLSPQNAANSLYLHQRSLNPRRLELYKQDDSFYIPPPVPPPQQMDGSQQIRNLNQLENVQSCQPYSISSANKMVFDDKIWPHNL